MNVNKMAAKDAARYAAANMFYGEGAGTRRKLLNAELSEKMVRYADTSYADLFNLEYEMLDLNKYAQNAIKERKRIDRAKFLERNTRGLLNGNKQSLTTGVALVGTLAYYAHQMGYDKTALEYSKKKYKKAKHWAHAKRTGFTVPKGV